MQMRIISQDDVEKIRLETDGKRELRAVSKRIMFERSAYAFGLLIGTRNPCGHQMMDELSNARLCLRAAAPLAACGCQHVTRLPQKRHQLFGILSQLPDDLVSGEPGARSNYSDRVSDPKSLRERRLRSGGGLPHAKMGALPCK